jgi:hypothetical protein
VAVVVDVLIGGNVTQLFDQMTVPDPLPLPRLDEVRLDLDGVFAPNDTAALDLSRFFAPPPTPRRRSRAPRTRPGTWVRAKGPGLVLVVAGALLGVAVARL